MGTSQSQPRNAAAASLIGAALQGDFDKVVTFLEGSSAVPAAKAHVAAATTATSDTTASTTNAATTIVEAAAAASGAGAGAGVSSISTAQPEELLGVDVRDSQGNTALCAAACGGHLDIIESSLAVIL